MTPLQMTRWDGYQLVTVLCESQHGWLTRKIVSSTLADFLTGGRALKGFMGRRSRGNINVKKRRSSKRLEKNEINIPRWAVSDISRRT